MLATTAAPCRPKTFDIDAGDLVLQIRSNSRHGQIVRLKSPKCTIGSAANCTLRLRARGVAPMHCLILRGPGGAVVRRWSPDTLLNHQSFTDAALALGDRLNVGPVEFEVLSSGSGVNWVAPAPVAERLPPPQLPDPEVEAERAMLDEERLRWQTERSEAERLLHERNEELNNRLAELNAQLAGLDAQRATLDEERRRWESTRDDRAAQAASESEQHNARTAELESQRQSLEKERLQWQTERTEAERQLAQHNEVLNAKIADLNAHKAEVEAQHAALDEERHRWESERHQGISQTAAEGELLSTRAVELESNRNALEQQRQTFDLERQQWQAERAESERQLSERHEELNARAAELDARAVEHNVLRQTFDFERQQWQTERAEWQRQVNERDGTLTLRLADLDASSADFDARTTDLATREATLDADRTLFHEERNRWQQQHEQAATQAIAPQSEAAEIVDEPAEPEFQTPVEQAPVNLADVLRRVGATVDLPDEEPAANRPATNIAKLIEPAAKATPRPPKHDADGDQEESIDDYMSRLMDRVRSSSGDSGPGAYAPPKSAPRRPAAKPPAAPVEIVRPQTVGQPQTPIEQREPVQMSPRTVAPERRADFSALRELANLSAHAAIDRHARRTLIRTMYSKLIVAVVAFLSGAALLWMWDSMQAGKQTFYSSLAALLVAIFWGLEYAILTGRLFVTKSGRIDWKSPTHREYTSPAAKEDAAEEASPEDADPSAATAPVAAVVNSLGNITIE